jgi:hypothetical protein
VERIAREFLSSTLNHQTLNHLITAKERRGCARHLRLKMPAQRCHGWHVKIVIRLAAGAVIFAIIGFGGWRMLRPGLSDPIYQGMPLSAWLKSLEIGNGEKNFDSASEAVHHIGTNALPMLLKMIARKDWGKRWASLALFVDSKESFVQLPEEPGANARTRAMFGFKALGSDAKPAVPELAQTVFNQPDNFEAAMAMVFIGVDAIPL